MHGSKWAYADAQGKLNETIQEHKRRQAKMETALKSVSSEVTKVCLCNPARIPLRFDGAATLIISPWPLVLCDSNADIRDRRFDQGNEIIQRLEDEVRVCKGKLKVKNAVTLHQETILREKEKVRAPGTLALLLKRNTSSISASKCLGVSESLWPQAHVVKRL
jgi:hypothetical protein